MLQSVPRRSRVNFIRYADDFIVTGKSKRLLETKVKPAIEEFLEKRGLRLSPEKTKITYIKDGFGFLGQDIRKFGRKLIITPSKEGFVTLIRTIGDLIRRHTSAPMDVLITKLNSVAPWMGELPPTRGSIGRVQPRRHLRIPSTVAHAPPQTS